MNIRYFKSKWEMTESPLEAFIERVAEDGFHGTELFLAAVTNAPDEVRHLHQRAGLQLVAQLVTSGATPSEHTRSLERGFARAVDCDPTKINLQAGRDIFGFEDNLRIYRRGLELSKEHGVPLLFETHRGRPTYSAVDTRRLLEHLPELRLTADFSHWMVVHESDLKDQEENVAAAIARSDHIHARVGHEEGPQVPHPSAPEWRAHLVNHIGLWKRIVERRRADGETHVTVTPEFGPPTYMPTLPFTGQAVADTWKVNVDMKRILEEAFSD